ncbi:hypothetical protein [Sphingopyxis sp.]|uniref:hypothetical protein n=1 Tax=Sphingopyxis sp. TaxID=1908224 RepID=UPI003D0F68C3
MAATAIALSGCNVSEKPTMPDDSAASPGVTREPVAAAEDAPVAKMPAQVAIQSQPGPEGSQIDLLKLAVTGDILTATFRCSSSEQFNSMSFPIPKISMIDDATAQQISILKDNAGAWLASNVSPSGYMGFDCGTKPGVFWAKFPAPPATSKTVSINIPGVAPFDGVPITR